MNTSEVIEVQVGNPMDSGKYNGQIVKCKVFEKKPGPYKEALVEIEPGLFGLACWSYFHQQYECTKAARNTTIAGAKNVLGW